MMINKISKVFLAVVIVFVSCLISVKAQVYVPPNMMSNPVLQRAMENRNMTTTAISGLIRSDMMRNGSRGRAKSGAKGGQSAPTLNLGVTGFKATSANSIVKSLVTQMGSDATEQRQAEEFFNQCLALYWETARNDGFPSNDLAYSFGYYVANNYHVYHNVYENAFNYDSPLVDATKHKHYIQTPSEKAIYQQFRTLLGSSPDIKKLTDKEKQQYAEMLVIMTNAPFKVYEAGLKNRDNQLIVQARKAAEDNLVNLFQTPADKIVINNQGISLSK